MMSEENRAQHKVMEAQVDKLTTMMQALLKFRAGRGDDDAGAEEAAPPSAEDIATKEAGDRGPLAPRQLHKVAVSSTLFCCKPSHHHPTHARVRVCIHRVYVYTTFSVEPHQVERTNEK